MSVSIVELEKVVMALAEALKLPKNDIVRDASVQRFKFCVELSWKNAKKVMGTSTSAPKDVIREMAQAGYISDVQAWLKAIDQRNLSAHTYNEGLANEVYAFAISFLPMAHDLIQKLRRA